MENQELFSPRTELGELKQAVSQLRQEIGKVVIGQHKMVELIISAILSEGHILIEGVPGIAKTLTSKIVARSISAGFSRIQFTPDLMPSDVLGTSIFNVKNAEFEFKKGPIFSNIVLIDEINRAPAKTQAALFEVMEELQVTIDGQTHIMGAPFIVIATQNPVEQEGTYRLPEAQLDRFLYKIEIDYPSQDEEEQILKSIHERKSNNLDHISPVLSSAQILKFREMVGNLHIDQNLLRYIAQLVSQTRNNSGLYLGASPRASIAIMKGAKAIAAIRGRDFVTPEDIKEVTYPVLGHRIMLTAEKEMEGITTKDIIKEIIAKVEVPR
jgi:MoxR-like ATPase